MKKIILFDQDIQHYRIPIYRKFAMEFLKYDYQLLVCYDKNICNYIDDELFQGVQYTFNNFTSIIKFLNISIVIQYVWMRYKFLLPFMVWARINRIKLIVWSHGINLQKKEQILMNLFYHLRQYLADALIIYSPIQKKFIKATHKKLFVANNTIDFDSLPHILLSKSELKQKYGLENKTIILSLGRFDKNNRKIGHIIGLSKLLNNEFFIIIVGNGITNEEDNEISRIKNIEYKGLLLDQEIVCELYKMADIFIMPGAVGLAINQAFYFGTPIIVEDVDQGPEAFYLKNGINGLYYKENNINDLLLKIKEIVSDEVVYNQFSLNAKKTIEEEGSIDIMVNGFLKAIEYVER